MTKRNGLQARLAWNSPSHPLSPFDLSTPFDRLRDRAQGTAGSGTTGRGLEPAPGLIWGRGSFPWTRSSDEKKGIIYKAIPKTVFPRHPPSSFRRKPESRGHLSPRPRLSPGRRAGAPLRKPISVLWIPAFMGMTTGWDLQGGNSPQKTPNRDTRNSLHPLYSGTDHSPLTT